MNVPKCAARTTPASSASPSPRRVKTSRRANATGAITSAAAPVRQNAIASAGAAVAAINGAEQDAQTIANASSPRSPRAPPPTT